MSKKKVSTPQRPQGHCAFCQGPSLTKQHLWPAWMGRDQRLPTYNEVAGAKNYRASGAIMRMLPTPRGRLSMIIKPPEHSVQNVAPGTRKLRMVCQACNNGWMSIIEDACRLIVEKLIANNAKFITLQQQLAIATWATQMTIVAEFAHLSNKAITYAERAIFFSQQLPLPHFNIFLGKYRGSHYRQQYFHTGHQLLKLQEHRLLTDSKPDVLQANFQTSLFLMGSLVIYVLSTSHIPFQPTLMSFTHTGLVKIGPVSSGGIEWKSMPDLLDLDIEFLHNYAWNIKEY